MIDIIEQVIEDFRERRAQKPVGDMWAAMRAVQTQETAERFLQAYLDFLGASSGDEAEALQTLDSNLYYSISNHNLPAFWMDALVAVLPDGAVEAEADDVTTSFSWGRDIAECAKMLAASARKSGLQRRAAFNDTTLVANPGTTPAQIVAQYLRPMALSRAVQLHKERAAQRLQEAAPILLEAVEAATVFMEKQTFGRDLYAKLTAALAAAKGPLNTGSAP